MEQFGLALILFAAFWVGCAAGYIAMRLRSQVAYEKGRNESAAEIAALQERLNGRDTQFNEARQRADTAVQSVAKLEQDLRAESDRRTNAEARLSLLPKYEAELGTRAQKIEEQQQDLTRLHVAVSELTARLEETKKTSEEKIQTIQTLQSKVAESFQTMSAEALVSNNKAFLDLAGDALARLQDNARGDLDQRQTLFGQIMEPLKSSLDRVDTRISELEKERASAYSGLQQQVESLMKTQASLQAETAHLASALRTPSSRGRWGEVQLRRVVELAGMLSHCDFIEPRGAEENAATRPDVIVQLPNHRQIVIDSKVSLAAYLASNDATDETARQEQRRQHAAQVRAHVEQLSAKGYWAQFPQSPEFVVAFLPGESFFSAALEHDPALLEFGVERRVILATPTTLIALLRAVAWGWKQELVSTNAKEIRDLGKELYDRLRALAENFTDVQRSMSRTTAAFNRTVGVFESNVIPAARRLRELGASAGDEIVSPAPVDSTPRSLHLLAEATESSEAAEPKLMALAAVPAAVASVAKPVEAVEVPVASQPTLANRPVTMTARTIVPPAPAASVPPSPADTRPAEPVAPRPFRPNGVPPPPSAAKPMVPAPPSLVRSALPGTPQGKPAESHGAEPAPVVVRATPATEGAVPPVEAPALVRSAAQPESAAPVAVKAVETASVADANVVVRTAPIPEVAAVAAGGAVEPPAVVRPAAHSEPAAVSAKPAGAAAVAEPPVVEHPVVVRAAVPAEPAASVPAKAADIPPAAEAGAGAAEPPPVPSVPPQPAVPPPPAS